MQAKIEPVCVRPVGLFDKLASGRTFESLGVDTRSVVTDCLLNHYKPRKKNCNYSEPIAVIHAKKIPFITKSLIEAASYLRLIIRRIFRLCISALSARTRHFTPLFPAHHLSVHKFQSLRKDLFFYQDSYSKT